MSEPLPLSATANLAEAALTTGLAAYCLVVIVSRLGRLPSNHKVALVLMLAPWAYIVGRDLYVDHEPDRAGLLYPLLVLAVWILRPPLRKLAVLGYLVGLTALISLALGAFVPQKGIYTIVTGQPVAPPKQILPWGVLVGLFTDGNNLGQFLAIGFATVALVRVRSVRVLLIASTLLALVWSSSRSSLVAVAIGAVVAILLWAVPRDGRRGIAAIVLVIVAGVVVMLPLTAPSDAAYTNRGFIWRFSLQAWLANPLVGQGSNWYSTLGQYANSLGGFAFHAHNQFVQTLVTGGLLLLALVTLMSATVGYAVLQWAGAGRIYPTVFLTILVISCSLEVSFGFVDRAFVLPVATLPIAFIVFGDGRAETAAIPSARSRMSGLQHQTEHVGTN